MNVNFKNLKLQNFLSFENESICFENEDGFIVLRGENHNDSDNALSNGSGKSAIWDGICYGITGETVRGVKDVKNIYTNGDAVVDIEFSVDNINYKIIRTKGKQSTIQFFVDGEDKSGKGVRDTQEIIENYLPNLTPQFIGSVIILGQGMPSRFSNNTPSGRKEILEQLSKSDFMIQEIKDKIAKRKESLQNDLRHTQDEKIKYEAELSVLEKQIETDENDLNRMTDRDGIENRLKEVKSSCKEKEDKKNELDKLCESFDNDIQVKRNEYTEIQKKQNDEAYNNSQKHFCAIKEVSENKAEVFAKISSLKAEITKIQSIKDVCPTCGQKIPNVIKPSTEEQEKQLQENELLYKELEDKLDTLEDKRKQDEEGVTAKYKKKLQKITEEGKDLSTKLSFVKTQRTELEKETVLLSQNLARLESDLEAYDQIKRDLTTKVQENKLRIEEVKEKIMYNFNNEEMIKKRIEIIKKFENSASREFRGYLLKNVIDYLNRQCEDYTNTICGHNIQIVLDKNALDIYYHDKIYESLSGGEKQKVDIVIQFALRKMLCVFMNFESNILVLDEIFDNCDTIVCHKIVELITEKLSNIDNIYIISHHIGELQIPYDKEIVVIKGKDNISRILQK